ncbi:hypothetical protein QL285_083210 [Trifolium repens]|nr:hypothetical protein QL285_083210 [Trifolium repens]
MLHSSIVAASSSSPALLSGRTSNIIFKRSSQFDPYFQSFISRRPHVRTQHLRVTTTHANSNSSNFFQESFVVLVRLKSILLGPLCLRNSETLVD